MTLKAVFFDLDGTLFDTAEDLGDALNCTLEKHGRRKLELSEIRSTVSDGANALLKLGFQVDANAKNFAELRADLLDNYLKNIAARTRPFEGIVNLIESMHQHQLKWGIVTNKPWAYTEALINKFSFASDPVAIICPDHVKEKKPAPDALLLACQQANCHVHEAIYVGDHIRDIECGKRAGVKATIAAAYGYIPPGEDCREWGANWLVESGEQLWPIINRYSKSAAE